MQDYLSDLLAYFAVLGVIAFGFVWRGRGLAKNRTVREIRARIPHAHLTGGAPAFLVKILESETGEQTALVRSARSSKSGDSIWSQPSRYRNGAGV